MKINVLFFEPSGAAGGSNRSMFLLLKYLDKTQFNPILVFGDTHIRDPWPVSYLTVPITPLHNYDFRPASWSPRWIIDVLRWIIFLPLDALRSARLLRRIRPDIVHINTGQPIVLGCVAKLMGYAVIWHIRELVCLNRLGALQAYLYSKCADTVIAISQAVAKRLGPHNNVVVVPNAAEASRVSQEIQQAWREKLSPQDHHLTVLLLGNFTPQKGYLFLADVAERLRDMPHIHFLLAGNYEDDKLSGFNKIIRFCFRKIHRSAGIRQTIRQRWREPLQRHTAHFLGQIDSAIALTLCDILVCPNITTEPFGRTVIEAYQYGKPVITTDIEAFDEIVRHGETGYRLPLLPDAWATTLRRLDQDRRLLQQLGANARTHAENYDATNHATTLANLYKNCMNRSPKPFPTKA